MLIRRADEMDGTPMQMDGGEGVTMRLMVGREDGAPTFSMRHFTVMPGGSTPRHSHNYEHEVYVVGGCGRIEQNEEFRQIKAGDVVYVAPNTTHQFTNGGTEALTFLCLVPSTFDCGTPTPGS